MMNPFVTHIVIDLAPSGPPQHRFGDFDTLDLADFDADAEAFDRVMTVVRAAARLGDGRHGLRVVPGSRLDPRRAFRHIFRHAPLGGIFLRGASPDEARSYAHQLAARFGGRVVARDPQIGEAHRGGLPHFHIALPDGRRSAHIFYGQTAPDGVFFDLPY
jgi:hypothetical protein